jgi:hypothetical protein
VLLEEHARRDAGRRHGGISSVGVAHAHASGREHGGSQRTRTAPPATRFVLQVGDASAQCHSNPDVGPWPRRAARAARDPPASTRTRTTAPTPPRPRSLAARSSRRSSRRCARRPSRPGSGPSSARVTAGEDFARSSRSASSRARTPWQAESSPAESSGARGSGWPSSSDTLTFDFFARAMSGPHPEQLGPPAYQDSARGRTAWPRRSASRRPGQQEARGSRDRPEAICAVTARRAASRVVVVRLRLPGARAIPARRCMPRRLAGSQILRTIRLAEGRRCRWGDGVVATDRPSRAPARSLTSISP